MEGLKYHQQLKRLQVEVKSLRVQMDIINNQNKCNDSCNDRWAGEVRTRVTEIKGLRIENHKLKSQIKNGIYEMRCAKCWTGL